MKKPVAKIGAKVVVLLGMDWQHKSISEIQGETKTCWRVNGKLFYKDTLGLRNAEYVGEKIKLLSDDELDYREKCVLADNVRNCYFSRFTKKQLEQILRWNKSAMKRKG